MLVALACGAVAHAQPRTLTLDEAVSLATQNNSAVKIAGDKVKAMDARVHEARASYFPALSNDSTAVHIADQQRIEIPQGALGVYPGIGPIPGTGVSLAQGKPNFGLSTTTLLTADHPILQNPRRCGREPRGCSRRPRG